MVRPVLAAIGGVTAVFASALCCAGPLIAVSLGVSGAGLASTFEPLRPYLLAGTGLFLGSEFFLLRREARKACEPGKPCANPGTRRRMKVMLWMATVAALVFATYPTWSGWILLRGSLSGRGFLRSSDCRRHLRFREDLATSLHRDTEQADWVRGGGRPRFVEDVGS